MFSCLDSNDFNGIDIIIGAGVHLPITWGCTTHCQWANKNRVTDSWNIPRNVGYIWIINHGYDPMGATSLALVTWYLHPWQLSTEKGQSTEGLWVN